MDIPQKPESIVATKAYSLALDIISLYRQLIIEKEFVLWKQILRSGTSIGAISLEVRETSLWLRFLKDSCYIKHELFNKLSDKYNELNKILSSIILTTKEKYFNKQG